MEVFPENASGILWLRARVCCEELAIFQILTPGSHTVLFQLTRSVVLCTAFVIRVPLPYNPQLIRTITFSCCKWYPSHWKKKKKTLSSDLRIGHHRDLLQLTFCRSHILTVQYCTSCSITLRTYDWTGPSGIESLSSRMCVSIFRKILFLLSGKNFHELLLLSYLDQMILRKNFYWRRCPVFFSFRSCFVTITVLFIYL